MIIGIPKEIKNNENRVGMTPSGVREMVNAGHTVYVQHTAGEGSGFADSEYEAAGAKILPTIEDVYGIAEMIVKVKEPIAPEYPLVRKGQVLFTIDQVQFQAAVDQAAANVNSAKSAVSTAEITEKNKRMLLDKNIISETEWQMAANQLAQAKAALAQANAALVTARKNLAYTTVVAPSDGVVGVIPNREGSLASPSSVQPLTTISDNSKVYAYFSLTEKDLLGLTDGGKENINAQINSFPAVKLQLADGSMYPLEGKVATVSGVIDNSTGAASARALFDNPSGMLRSGNTGQIIIPHNNEGVLVIPQKATYEVQDLRYVYTLNDSNMAVSRHITVDPYNDGKNFVVTSGLNPGDRVVVEGVGTVVRPGIVISPKQ